MDHPSLGPDGRFATRRLAPPDLPALQALFERAADYFEIMTGAPPGPDEAERAFVGGPPSKAVSDKHTVGVFDAEGTLVGVLDAIPDFPADDTCTIGMLLLDPAVRGAGLGSAVLAHYEAWAAPLGARRFRTALVAHHAPGLRFLHRAGYAEVSRHATVAVLEKDAPR